MLTCDAVRDLVERHGKEWAIVIAGDRPGGEEAQFVTWGKSAEAKVYAAKVSNHVGLHLYGEAVTVHESFVLDAARNKQALEQLRDTANRLADLMDAAMLTLVESNYPLAVRVTQALTAYRQQTNGNGANLEAAML